MAEIKIQEKKSPIWPWILGLILVAAVAWYIIANRDNDDDNLEETSMYNDTTITDTSDSYLNQQTSGGDEVNRFVEFVQNDTTQDSVENYARTGLMHLVNAINEVIDENNIGDDSIRAQMDSLESYTQNINEGSNDNAVNIRTALVSAADLLQAVQQKQYPDLKASAAELKKTAQGISGNLNRQGKKIKEFFSKASETLQGMVNSQV